MTILEFKRHFKSQLSEIYSESESAELYSIFIYKIVGFDKFQQRRFSHQELLKSDEEDLQKIIEILKTKKPYQQILGETEFYRQKFFVDENVLIPRPETEEILEFAIHEIKNSKLTKERIEKSLSFGEGFRERIKILDIGTGSGIIPIILKKHFPEAEVSAIDISEKALEIAKKNAKLHQTEINFFQKDFLAENLDEVYDFIISNPPYIGVEEEVEIADSVKEFEPKIALFSPTQDALIFYKKIAENCGKNLSENGMVFLEINQKFGKETLELFKNFSESKLLKDLSGNDRIVFARK